jgi:hypothetical protein
MTQPAGGTTNADSAPIHGPNEVACGIGPIGDRLRAMAATLSVPTKLAHPCMADPARMKAPKQIGGEPTPGQRSAQSKVPGSMRIRASVPSRAATASNAMIAVGHSSGIDGPEGNVTSSGTQVTDGLAAG